MRVSKLLKLRIAKNFHLKINQRGKPTGALNTVIKSFLQAEVSFSIGK